MTIADKVRELLEGLGSTADDVADMLRAKGITGTPEDPCNCPIANLIKAEIPGAADEELWDTDEEVADYFVCSMFVRADFNSFNPPLAVSEFIRRFDDCHYSDLARSE